MTNGSPCDVVSGKKRLGGSGELGEPPTRASLTFRLLLSPSSHFRSTTCCEVYRYKRRQVRRQPSPSIHPSTWLIVKKKQNQPSPVGTRSRLSSNGLLRTLKEAHMPPVLNPNQSKVDGLAFLGLSLTRKSSAGHPNSVTHQTAFDLNDVLDRNYQYLFSTNDDGWLVGGGEPGPPHSYKLAARDSAHVELMRIGTYNPAWGGITVNDVVTAIQSGRILIPQIEVVPTAVVANPDLPPELEIRFDMEPRVLPPSHDSLVPLPINWQLRFIHNQLFKYFQFPSRFCPGAFHSTIVRKAEFRSPQHRAEYFAKCEKAVQSWKKAGVQPLVPPDPLDDNNIAVVQSSTAFSPDCMSGLWLFTDRENITHFFCPNFLPPYDSPEKRATIMEFLSEEWDEGTLSWKPLQPDEPTAFQPSNEIKYCGVESLLEAVFKPEQ